MPKLKIIGGRDCQSVNEVPAHESTFNLGSISIRSIHTPCHTQDSVCYFLQDGDDKAVFTGDTLFIGGRLPGRLLSGSYFGSCADPV